MSDFVDPSITTEIVEAKNKLVTQANRAETIVDDWESTGNLVVDAPADNKLYGRKNAVWEELNIEGTGDMTKNVYDPQAIQADSFDRANHTGVQEIDTVSGLTDALNSKLEDAPVDGVQYARLNGTWQEVDSGSGLTTADVLRAARSKGSDTNWATQLQMYNSVRGSYRVDAIGTSDKGTFPYEAVWLVTLRDDPASGYYNNGTWNTSEVVSGYATILSLAAGEPDEAKGIYEIRGYASGLKGSLVPEFTQVVKSAGVEAAVAWGNITGTLSDQTDLQSALDDKLDSSSYTASDVKTKYESNADTNAFTDTEQTKLTGIEDGAEVNKFDFNDAASDGNEYVRKNGTWSVASGGGGAVDSVFGRTGTVVAVSGDYADEDITAAASATNYTPTGATVEGHLAGIDSALASTGGGGIDWSKGTVSLIFTNTSNYAIPPANLNRMVKLAPSTLGSGMPLTALRIITLPTPSVSGDEIMVTLYPSEWYGTDGVAYTKLRFSNYSIRGIQQYNLDALFLGAGGDGNSNVNMKTLYFVATGDSAGDWILKGVS